MGTSRSVEQFAERSGVPLLFYAATGASPRVDLDLELFASDARAAATGALAGAVYGFAAVPHCGAEPLHVSLPGTVGPQRVLYLEDMEALARGLLAASPDSYL